MNFVLCLSTVVSLNACSNSTTTSEPSNSASTAASSNSNVIKVGSDLTYPPFAYMSDNKPNGFDVEFMNLLGKASNQKIEFVDTRFANLIPGLNSKKFETIASALYITPEREQQVNFIPYAQVGGVLITRKGDESTAQKPEDLCGKTVASIKGASWIPKLNDVSSKYCSGSNKAAIKINEFETSPEALQSLLAKSTDIQFEDSAVAKSLVEKSQDRVVVSSKDILYPQKIGLAIAKSDQKTQQILEKAFEEIKSNGEYSQLLSKYALKQP